MKYILQIREIQGAKRIILPILSRQPRCFGSFEAVIDTGSPRTILSAMDATKLNIPFNSLREGAPIIGFGKGSMPILEIEDFLFLMKSENSSTKKLTLKLAVPNIPELRKRDKNSWSHAFSLPSLIGVDFLEINKLKLVVDIANNSAFLED